MKSYILAILVWGVSICSALATAQISDKIFYGGKEYSLHTNPMEDYFSKHPDKKPKDGDMSTALWRGYVATFEFRERKLVLKDIEIEVPVEKEREEYPYEWKSVLYTVVPKGKTLQIDWFTGILVLPFGEMINYVHMGYGSTFSNYILLEIKEGILTGNREFDYKQCEAFKEKQFQAYKKTIEYKKQVEEMRKENDSQEFIDSFLRSFVVDYTSKFLDGEK